MAEGKIEPYIGLAQLCIELADEGDIDRYAEAEKCLTSAIKYGVHDRSSSKLLIGKELAQVYYLRGYVRVKLYESKFGGQFQLMGAKTDFNKCAGLDEKGDFNYKANSALQKLSVHIKEVSRSRVFEWLGPLMVCVLAFSIFVLAQLDFFLGVRWLFGVEQAKSKSLNEPVYYAAVTFGSLLFMVVGLYLSKVSKLKVGAIELEKSTVAQISSPTSLDISR
jgi:hypothetical protein